MPAPAASRTPCDEKYAEPLPVVRDLDHLVSKPSGDIDNEHERKCGEGKSYTRIAARERQEPSQT